jgi:ectoine hydroxylase-related dioxygenase (phytanoyl-CoA dioxygenase family)
MMDSNSPDGVPFYGVLKRNIVGNTIDRAVEEIVNLGFSVIDSGFSHDEIQSLASKFDCLHAQYLKTYGNKYLQSIDEHNNIRLPLVFDHAFIELATNTNVLSVVERLIVGKFMLNQQNGIVNPAGEKYSQGAWHRDLPYQHFVSSHPIAMSALYCVDDFTKDNGATHVLPASHKQESFPSDAYTLKHSAQITARAGSFIMMDSMTFHRGGVNNARAKRRAINHIYTIPHIKQLIDIRALLGEEGIDARVQELLGYRYGSPRSIDDFLKTRNNRRDISKIPQKKA